MANTITNLTVELYNALDVVSREQIGLIPSVTSDMTYDRAAVNQTVRSPVAPAATATDTTPGVTPPDDGDQVIGNSPMTITKSRRVPIRWNGEQRLALDNNGAPYNVILRDQIAQAMRTLTNEIEADLASLHVYGSRAYGVPGTTPFATAGDFTDATMLGKILKDNGAPMGDAQLILDTAAGATLVGKQSRYDISGDAMFQKQGIIDMRGGFSIRESAAVVQGFGSGTGITANVTVTALEAVGQTVINVTTDATGAVNLVAGDVITFAGDSTKYIVAADVTIGNSTTGDITIQAPGLIAPVAATTAVSGAAVAARNMGFARSAIALATRLPALPEQGDIAMDRMTITDPLSGLSFEVSLYPQYRQVQYEIAIAWGVAAVKKEHIAILLG